MTDSQISDLASESIRAAARGAAEYLAQNGGDDVSADDLHPVLVRHVQAALPGAIKDCNEAADCGMGAVAATTYMASMTLAGIAAAKELIAA